MIKVFLEHYLANVFANFQRDISINAEASPMTISKAHVENTKKL